jgi:hypothetical protein
LQQVEVKMPNFHQLKVPHKRASLGTLHSHWERLMNRVVEIRSYNLKPGTRTTFHQMMEEQAMPMLKRWQVDVVAYGPSLHDDDSYYLMRAYPSLEDRQQSQDAFYGSAEWREGPREPLLALIENYTSTVIEVDDATLAGLRRVQMTSSS